MSYPGPFPIKVEQGGTGEIALAANAVLIGQTADDIGVTNVGTNGQLLIGATAAPPAFASLTSSGGTIVITTGANTLNIEASGSTSSSFPTDSGTAVPALGALTIAGGANIATSGSGSTVTIDLDGVVPIANGGTNASSMATTDGTVIFDGTRLVTTATGTSGQVLTSNGVGVAPTYQNVSASGAVTSVSGGNNITITGTATAPIVNVSGTTNHAVQVGNSTNSLTSLSVGTNGQVLLGATAADPSFITPTAGTGLSITTNATTLQYALFTPVSVSNGGTGATSFTAHSLLVGEGTGAIVAIGAATNGQLPIGSTGADPVLATLTAGSNISITNGAGSITIATTGSTGGADTFHTDSGDATASGNAITMAGGNNISTSGSGSTVTYSVSGTSNHAVQVGTAAGALNSLSVGTNGQVLLGSTGADPSFITPTAGTGLSITTNATTLQYALSTPVSIANGGTNATSMTTTDGTIIFDGTRLVTTTTGTAGQVLTSNGVGVAPTYQNVSASGAVTSVSGGNNITITGTATAPIVNVSGTTNHAVQVGNSTNSLTSLSVGTNGQVLLGATAADPSFITPTAGTGLSITTNATTLQYALSTPVSVSNGGTGASSFTAHSLILGQGTSAMTALGAATNGQLPIGSTGADPVLATLTAGTGISVTNGAGSITLAASATTPLVFHTGSGDATPAANAITIAGGNNISTTGSGSTVTVAVSGTTNHTVQVGNASGSLTSLTAGTNGQVLLGSTGADPAFITPTAGTGLSITTNATTLQYALSTPVSVSNGGTGATSFTAHSLILGQGTSAMTALGAATNGQIPIGSTGADPVLATITAGSGITVTNGAGSITIAASGGTGITWNEITTTSQSMAVNNGYIANNAGLVTLTLPSTAAQGSIIEVTGKGAGGWKIAQNSGQTIYFGTSTTTTGTGGSLASSATRDGVRLVCITANNDFNVLSAQGNLTVV